MGGECLNYGCVPSKALIKSAKLAHQMRKADHYGLEAVAPKLPFARVMARVHHVIADIAPHDSVERYTNLGVEVLEGYAKLIDPWTIEVALNDGTTQRLTGRAIIIATGAQPFVPPLPGIDEVGSDLRYALGCFQRPRCRAQTAGGVGGRADRLRIGAELCPARVWRYADRDGPPHHDPRG